MPDPVNPQEVPQSEQPVSEPTEEYQLPQEVEEAVPEGRTQLSRRSGKALSQLQAQEVRQRINKILGELVAACDHLRDMASQHSGQQPGAKPK